MYWELIKLDIFIEEWPRNQIVIVYYLIMDEISSLEDFLSFISKNFTCGHYIYRGVLDGIKHKLIPSVGRNEAYAKENEIETFQQFKRRSHSTVRSNLEIPRRKTIKFRMRLTTSDIDIQLYLWSIENGME